MRLALAALIALAPGTPAWGQLARVVPRTAPAVAAPVPGLAPALAPSAYAPSPSALPSLSPTLPSSRLLLPSPQATPSAAARPSLPAAAERAAVREAGELASLPPLPQGREREAVASALQETASQAGPLLEAASSAETSAGDAHSSGASLEALLTRGFHRAYAAPVFAPAPNAASPARLEKGAEAPAPAPAEVPAPAKRAFTLYTAGVSTVKAGIETLNLVVPILLLSQYGAASILGALFVSAQVAGLAAGAGLAPLIDRLGPSKTLAAAAAAQAAVIGVVPLSLWLGAPVSLPVLFGLFALNGALSGVFDIARRSAPPAILGTDEGVLRRYNARLYIAREIAAMGAVFGAGWLLHHVGAMATLGVHPAAYAVAAGLFLLLSRLRRGAPSLGAAAPVAEAPRTETRWAEFTAGARIVLADPALRLAALVNIPVIALHNMFHAMLAAVYATSVLGSPALAAVLIGAWNAGELAAALFLERRGRKTGAAFWARYAGLVSLAGWALWAFPTVWVAAPVAFLLASATLGNEIGLNSFFQAAAPKERTAAVTGFVYSSATGAAMLVMLGMGWVFDAFGALPGFLALAAALTLTAGLYLLAARAFARKAPPSTPSS